MAVRRRPVVAACALALAATVVHHPSAVAQGREVFVPGIHVSVDGASATFPLRTGRTVDGRSFDYIVVEASTSAAADTWGVEVVNKLRHAGRVATQPGRLVAGSLVVPGTVDFSPALEVSGTPGVGFPPVVATPGSVADAAYSPLVRLPDGAVLNAPQVGNGSGLHDKVISLDRARGTVTLRLTDGFARGEAVVYLSTDASVAGPAALEGSTYVPRLGAAPGVGDDSTKSSRAGLVAFVNGPTGSPSTRQGINSALLGEGDPLNVLAWRPGQGRYSPLWDVHLSAWAAGTPVRQTSFADVEDLADEGRVTAPDGSAWTASAVVVNCPIIARS